MYVQLTINQHKARSTFVERFFKQYGIELSMDSTTVVILTPEVFCNFIIKQNERGQNDIKSLHPKWVQENTTNQIDVSERG